MEHNLSNEQISFPTESPSFLLWQVNTIWNNKKKEAINKIADISQLQYMILANLNWLNEQNGETTQIQLANHLGMESMNISQALKILEKNGYVLRKQHTADTRAKAVELSKKGKEIQQKIDEKINEAESSFFNVLGDEKEVFKTIIQKLINIY